MLHVKTIIHYLGLGEVGDGKPREGKALGGKDESSQLSSGRSCTALGLNPRLRFGKNS